MSKITNDDKMKRVRIRKILKVFIILFGFLTLVLAIYSLVTKASPIYAIISFIIEFVLSKYREKLDPKEVKSDSKNQE